MKTGAGTRTLSGANGYSGGTTVSNGTLRAGAADVFGSGRMDVQAGTLGLANFNQSVASLAGGAAGAVTLGTATLDAAPTARTRRFKAS